MYVCMYVRVYVWIYLFITPALFLFFQDTDDMNVKSFVLVLLTPRIFSYLFIYLHFPGYTSVFQFG